MSCSYIVSICYVPREIFELKTDEVNKEFIMLHSDKLGFCTHRS